MPKGKWLEGSDSVSQNWGKKGWIWSEKINFNHSTSECENESFKKAEIFRKIIGF